MFLALFFVSLVGASEPGMDHPPVTALENVDLSKYFGNWFEIKRLPNKFQENCYNSVAFYEPLEDQSIRVRNQCMKRDDEKKELKPIKIEGRAWNVDPKSNSKLEVSFVKFIWWWRITSGDYWILGVGPQNRYGQYIWAVVGHPSRKYGWILARESKLDEKQLKEIDEILMAQGYNPGDFKDFALTAASETKAP